MCIATPSVVAQPDEDSYGVYGQAPNPFDQGSVEVPELTINLTLQQQQHLQERYQSLAPSDLGGLDIYVSVREEVGQMLQ